MTDDILKIKSALKICNVSGKGNKLPVMKGIIITKITFRPVTRLVELGGGGQIKLTGVAKSWLNGEAISRRAGGQAKEQGSLAPKCPPPPLRT